ncbi:hypothetical protein ACHAC9_04880 [Massilia sp. CMS3.1]
MAAAFAGLCPVLSLLAAGLAQAAQPATMRVDYSHSGNALSAS